MNLVTLAALNAVGRTELTADWVVDDRWGDLRFSQVFMANRSCWHQVGIRLASCWEMRLGVGDCAKPA